MPQLLDTSLFSVIDTDGSIGVGWELNFYIKGTSTRKDTFPTSADATAGTNANSNPIVIASDGRLPAIWLADDADYKGILTDENGVVKETIVQINGERLAATTGPGLIGFSHAIDYADGTLGAHAKHAVYVTDAPYNAVGDGVTDDSAAIQAAIDANKGGTIILPAGYTFLAAGVLLTGSTYNNTKIIIEGDFKLKAAAGGANFQSVTWGGIIFHDVVGCTLSVPGWMDGNRANQDASEQRHCVILAGVRNMTIPVFKCREVRGDGIYINIKTLASASTNSSGIYIGPVHGYNTADDGRNVVSIVSGENITLAGGVSIKIGGVINGSRMPGGFDIEPDDASKHLVKNVRSGSWVIETAGTSGIACIGDAITDDATRDWCIQDVSIASSQVTNTAGVGYPIFKRGLRVSADVSCIQTGTRTLGCSIDYQDFGDFRVRAKGVTSGVAVGTENFVNDSHVHVMVEDHSEAGLLSIGANRSRFTGHVRGGQGAGSYGVQVSVGSRGTVEQTGVVYSVDVPYDANNSFGFQTGTGLTFTNCVVCDCAFLGYANYLVMFGFNTNISTRNVQGRNFGTAAPANGYWAASDIVWNTGASAGGTPGWICTAAGNPGTWKAMANVAA